MTDTLPVFSAQEVGDFLDAIAIPKRLVLPAWWRAFKAAPDVAPPLPMADFHRLNAEHLARLKSDDAAPAAPVIDVSPELAAVDTPSWLRPSPYPGGDWPPPPGFVS